MVNGFKIIPIFESVTDNISASCSAIIILFLESNFSLLYLLALSVHF